MKDIPSQADNVLQPEIRSQTYPSLFVNIDDGKIKIPRFQREFVWSKEQTAALLDSLIKGFPIGTFIYWETSEELRCVKEIGNFKLSIAPSGHPVSYVLDGQQRITSLYAVRKGILFSKDNKEMDYKDISIDLSADPEGDDQIVFSSPPRSPSSSSSIPVYNLLNSSLTDWLDKYEKTQIDNIGIYQARFQRYSFSTVVIGDKYPIDIATEVFTRINTGGTELNLFEIMVAKTYSEKKDFDLSQKYENLIHDDVEKSLDDANYETIPPPTVLQCMAICLGREVRRKDILRLERNKFIGRWEDVKSAIFSAVEFLRNELRIPVSKLLPYNALLVPLTYFFFKRNKSPTTNQVRLLTQYFWWASLSHRFSSAADSNLAADRRKMKSILANKSPDYRGEECELTLKNLTDHSFSTGDAFCKAILCLYASLKPRSFEKDNYTVRIDNSWLQQKNSMNYHHFFPRSYLKEIGVQDWKANSIMNITIVDDYLNKQKIKARSPSDYMNEFQDKNPKISDTMKTHLIGDFSKFGIWEDNYDKFIKARAKLVLAEINSRLFPEEEEAKS